MKHGKKYAEAAKAVDRQTLYDIPEAIDLAKKTAVAKFDETIDTALFRTIRTGRGPRIARAKERDISGWNGHTSVST